MMALVDEAQLQHPRNRCPSSAFPEEVLGLETLSSISQMPDLVLLIPAGWPEAAELRRRGQPQKETDCTEESPYLLVLGENFVEDVMDSCTAHQLRRSRLLTPPGESGAGSLRLLSHPPDLEVIT